MIGWSREAQSNPPCALLIFLTQKSEILINYDVYTFYKEYTRSKGSFWEPRDVAKCVKRVWRRASRGALRVFFVFAMLQAPLRISVAEP